MFVNTKQDRHAPRRGWIRAGLLVLAASMIGTGCWALSIPAPSTTIFRSPDGAGSRLYSDGRKY
jgi:hypothetical protein